MFTVLYSILKQRRQIHMFSNAHKIWCHLRSKWLIIFYTHISWAILSFGFMHNLLIHVNNIRMTICKNAKSTLKCCIWLQCLIAGGVTKDSPLFVECAFETCDTTDRFEWISLLHVDNRILFETEIIFETESKKPIVWHIKLYENILIISVTFEIISYFLVIN